MQITRTITTVDTHTGGEPFRIITSGLPRLPGDSIVARRAWLLENADDIRRALMLEPRGHADMYGGYLTTPVSPEADFGVIFLHNAGYSDHCGHGVIALATAAVELGWVQRQQPETRVGIDAPCGFIEAFVQWDGLHANSVRFINVPSFIYQRDVTVVTPDFGAVTGDIAYGGAFYFYTCGEPHALQIRESQIEALTRFGAQVKTAANLACPVVHPQIPQINHIYGTIIDGPPRHAGSTQANCCVFADRQIDRSATGSGTAGRAAQLYQRGQLALNELLINESVIGTIMSARILHETVVSGLPAVVPQISGSAHVCGYSTWILDGRDPLMNGFLVRPPDG
ncbi:MAG: proline racemase family protein [Woeseiaceae bacterium]|nr:proline racemase family protein [Woeseiaceae bacterium]